MTLLLRTLAVALLAATFVGTPLIAMHLLRDGWSERAFTATFTVVGVVVVLVARWLLHRARMRRRAVDPVL